MSAPCQNASKSREEGAVRNTRQLQDSVHSKRQLTNDSGKHNLALASLDPSRAMHAAHSQHHSGCMLCIGKGRT